MGYAAIQSKSLHRAAHDMSVLSNTHCYETMYKNRFIAFDQFLIFGQPQPKCIAYRKVSCQVNCAHAPQCVGQLCSCYKGCKKANKLVRLRAKDGNIADCTTDSTIFMLL